MTSGPVTVAAFCAALVLLMPARVCADAFDSLIDEDTDLGELLDDIPRLDPVSATVTEFAGLPSFTADRAVMVVAYRDSTGSLERSDGRAAAIPGLSAVQQAVLDHLVMTTSQAVSLPSPGGSIRSGVIHRPYDQELPDSRYYLKLVLDTGHKVTATVIGDRDPFEPKGLDHVSASASWRPGGGKNLVVIGDYRPSFGQRLLFSRYTRSYLDGADTFQSNPALVANTSFDETSFLRGGYVSMAVGPVTVEAFSSRRMLDATIVDGGAAAIQTDGLHTGSASAGNLTETVHALGVTAGRGERWHLGVMGAASAYAPELVRRGGERTLNDPAGDRFTFLSAAGDLATGPARVFFEHAVMSGGEHAGMAGIEAGQDRIRGGVAIRDYSAGYRAFRAAGIQSFGGTDNERGIYAALEGTLANRASFAASFDIARTPARTYLSPLPRTRRRLNLRTVWPIRRRLSGTLGFRSVDDIDTGSSRSSLKLSVDRDVTRGAGYGWHAIAALTDGGGTTGVYAEGRLVSLIGTRRVTIAAAGFDIPGYEARLYRSEPDVPGRSMSRPVWGRGGYGTVVTRIGPVATRYRYLRSDLAGRSHELTVQMDIRF